MKIGKKSRISVESHLMAYMILEEWFQLNPQSIYPTTQEKRELARRANLKLIQITTWFKNKRKSIFLKHNRLTLANKIILLNYFNNINKKPSLNELTYLSVQIGRPENKIRKWFAFKRFKFKKDMSAGNNI